MSSIARTDGIIEFSYYNQMIRGIWDHGLLLEKRTICLAD